jgi:hypothetical protein
MKRRRKRIFRGVALAFAVAAFAAQTAQARPLSKWDFNRAATPAVASYTAPQLRALELRSQGMNERYISAVPTLTAQQLRTLVTRFQGTNVGFGLTGSTASGVHTSTAATPALTAQQLEQELRFQGVDKQHGLIGRTTSSTQSSSLTGQQLQEELRFQGVDKRNGLIGQTESSVQSSSTPTVASSSDGISWGDAFAGAGAVVATAIVLLAGFTVIRRREHPVGV